MKIHCVLFVLGIAIFQLGNAEYVLDSSESSEDVERSSEVNKCGKGKYFSLRNAQCLECGKCGSNMYEKIKCHENVDTVCDWCLADNPVRNDAFFHECDEYIQVFGKFRKELKAEMQLVREESESASGKRYWVFYALLFMVPASILLLTFWLCCMQRKYTRVINVTPPQLSEMDDHNIIFAANHLREKVATKRGSVPYEYL